MATILIVDDHVLNREFLITLLGYGGHRLLEAADGAEGLKVVQAEHPDLVITDILMPHMDGYEFVTRMHEDPDPDIASTPIIFYTAAYREREATVMGLACGVRWVLPKPSEPEAILETVRQALGLPAASQPQPALTPPPPEGSRFATIDNQMAEYLVEIETSSQLMSQIAHGGKRSTSDLEQMALRLSKSLSSLQAVSLRLTALIELGIELAAEREPGVLLETGCRTAQNICVARYAAIGILGEDGEQLERFVSRGLDQVVQTQWGAAASQSALFRPLLERGSVQRTRCAGGDPCSIGLPSFHPAVNAVLGVPIASRAHVYGWLYLADKLGADEFSEIDERAAATVASQLAVAYESLVFYEKIERQHAQLKIEMEERLQAQQALRQTLRARTVMAECNHVMVHATDEMTLLTDMCRTVVEVGRYRLAWIGYSKEDGTILPQACAGLDDNFLQTYPLRWDNSEQALCPSGAAIRSGRAYSVADITPEDGVDDWRRQAHARGCHSVLALPMRNAGYVLGTLTIFESEPNAFDDTQIAMFEELVDDIAYGIVNFHIKEARAQAEQALQATEEKLSGILNSIDNVVWSASSEGLIYLNQMAEKVFGRPLAEFFQGRDLMFDVIHPEDQPQVMRDQVTLLQQGAVTKEYRIRRPDGTIRWLEQRSKAVRDDAGNLLRVDAVATDITERKKYEARIGYLADHDALTDLANRNLLGDRITQAMRQARRAGASLLALLFLDLDRFKNINDSYGHTVGDKLLKAVAKRLLDTVREGDTVARQGGDEFIILLVGMRDPQDIVSAVNKIINAFASPFVVDDHQLHITASIGVTVFPTDGTELPDLLRNADTAMYRAKDECGNTYQFYSREMSERAIERAEMENALRGAIERHEFELFYQPKVDIISGRVIGAEALIRWHHPEMGLVEPQQFIPLAEEVGLIVPIGDWVLRAAHAQNKAWRDAGLAPLHIAVNLSVRQFLHDGLVEAVASVLEDTGLDGSFLELELTESMVMNNAEHFVVKLHQLKSLGVQLSIDDFGTGYSSLSYLKRFPIDRLKIDQSFIRDSASNGHDAAIIRSVIELGHSLNFKVIAEGVETWEQLAFLRANRCDEIQGYYFSEPVPAGEFATLFSAGWHLNQSGSRPRDRVL